MKIYLNLFEIMLALIQQVRYFLNMTTTPNEPKTKTTYEIHEGVKGNGNTMYRVATVREDGAWLETEDFDNRKEAEAWIKWSV